MYGKATTLRLARATVTHRRSEDLLSMTVFIEFGTVTLSLRTETGMVDSTIAVDEWRKLVRKVDECLTDL